MGEIKKVPEIRFGGFTDQWKKFKLFDLADIIGGGTPSTLNKDYWNGTINWFAPAEMEGDRYKYNSLKKITVLGLENSGATILPADRTILFTSRAGIGKMAILKNSGSTNQGFQSLVLKEEIDTYFIFSAGDLIRKYALSKASGSTFLEISSKILGKMPFYIPDAEEQKAIGTFFNNLDNLIKNHNTQLKKLTNLKKAMLIKMFPQDGASVPEIRFKGFDREWVEESLNDLANIVRGASPRPIKDPKWFDKSSEIGWLRISDVTAQDGKIKHLSQRISEAGQEKTRVLQTQHLLLSIAASVGKPVLNYVKTGVHDGFLIFLDPEFELNFMFHWLKMFEPKWQIYGQPGSQVNLNSDIVKNHKVFIPCKSEQKQIGDFFDNTDRQIENNKEQLKKLNQIKKACLSKLFVSQD